MLAHSITPSFFPVMPAYLSSLLPSLPFLPFGAPEQQSCLHIYLRSCLLSHSESLSSSHRLPLEASASGDFDADDQEIQVTPLETGSAGGANGDGTGDGTGKLKGKENKCEHGLVEMAKRRKFYKSYV